MNLPKSKGFTLIELLVVVAIIGILATIVLSALGDARASARDARRESDIKTIQNALEIYYIENGRYPSGNFLSGNSVSWENFETILGVTLPRDPINEPATTIFSAPYDELQYGYYSSATAAWCANQLYFILYNMETKIDTENNRINHCGPGVSGNYGQAFLVGVSPRD